MKFLFFIFILFSHISYSQNYSGQYPGAMHFYSVNGSNTLTSIQEDSSYSDVGTLIRLPELLMRDVVNENIVDSNCVFWGGQQCMWKKDGATLLGSKIISGSNFVKYFNFYGDSLNVNFAVLAGNTQTVFQDQDTNVMVKYFCLTKDTATIFGVADSIIQFTVITTDSLGNLITSDLSGDTVIYTKNTGLLRGFSFGSFPAAVSSIELMGIRNPNFGFFGMTYADAYNYQVGDSFEKIQNGPGGFLKKLFQVLTRSDNVNDVTYSFKVITATAQNYPPTIYTYDTTFISLSYSKLNYIDIYDNCTYQLNSSLFSGCYNGVSMGFNYWDYCDYTYCPSADCYGGSDCFGALYHYGSFFEGIGLAGESVDQNGMGMYSYTGTSYVNINGVECGSSFILSDSDYFTQPHISIYPNPTQNLITIESDLLIQDGKISITDLSGREMIQLPFSASLQLNLESYSTGIYLVNVYSGSVLLSASKLIIN